MTYHAPNLRSAEQLGDEAPVARESHELDAEHPRAHRSIPAHRFELVPSMP